VLVVEDDRTARRAIASILKRQGYAVFEAATLADAVLARELHRPAWVLLDLMLPDGFGTGLLRQLRDEGWPARVCVITGCNGALLSEARELEPERLFTKPLDVNGLLETLAAR
jgi:DNA-binding response OmpR family regulator